MTAPIRPLHGLQALRRIDSTLLAQPAWQRSFLQASAARRRWLSVSVSPRASPRYSRAAARRLLTTRPALQRRAVGHNNEEVPDSAPTTDFSRMDVLGSTPVPATSVDACMSDGFALNSGAKVLGGSGALLVGGEAFAWRPWESCPPGRRMALVNERGQWEVEDEAWGVLGLVWPRPDLLILGLGPEMRPLSPRTKRYLSGLGVRIEVLDTRNAASQFNLLATERGVDNVAAALIPIGWKEGVGAV